MAEIDHIHHYSIDVSLQDVVHITTDVFPVFSKRFTSTQRFESSVLVHTKTSENVLLARSYEKNHTSCIVYAACYSLQLNKIIIKAMTLRD